MPIDSLPILDPFEALVRLFRGLERKGPGADASTLRALQVCKLPPSPAVLDLGCGSGASTLILAKALGEPIIAVDACGPFLDELEAKARAQGLSSLIRGRCMDFGQLDFQAESFDLIWSEGAIFCLGWEAGLRAWKPLLKPGAYMALTESVWLSDNPPEAIHQAWAEWYPAITDIQGCRTVAESLGFEVVESFALPPEAWLDYYAPLEKRCQELKKQTPPPDPALAQVIEDVLVEINHYRKYGEHYGYAFFVLKKA